MNILPKALALDFQRVNAWWGLIFDSVEKEYGLPPRMLYAIGSRETNLGRYWDTPPPTTWDKYPTYDNLTYFVRNPGDEGHGHGILQIDDRSHNIPAGWRTDIKWQITYGAEVLRNGFKSCGTWEGACNAYNSGRCNTSATTGKDYGPDVMERHAFLVANFPPKTLTQNKKGNTEMMIFFNEKNVGFLYIPNRPANDRMKAISGADKDKLKVEVPEIQGALSDDLINWLNS